MSPVVPDGALVQTAEEYAAGMIRRALDSAVRPDLQRIAGECALQVREVEAIRDRILSGKKGTQTLGRPRAAHAPASPPRATAAPPAGPAETTPATPGESWRAAKDHPVSRVCRAHDRAVAAIVLVESLLAEEAQRARLAERERRLAAELAAVRAEMRGEPATKKAARAQQSCPECGWTGARLNMHAARVHRAAS